MPNISVNQSAPARVEVRTTPTIRIDTDTPVATVDVQVGAVQPELAGFWVERNINGIADDFTIWFEDGIN